MREAEACKWFLPPPGPAVPQVQGLSGPWSITGGTGSYRALRGKGTATVDASTGVNSSPITFSDTWTGIAEFDATAPTGSVTTIKFAHPLTRRDRWRVAVFFSARDNVDGNPIRFRRAERTRSLRIAIMLSDPWGNEKTITKNIPLR
jgi:hypothetical protein